MVVDTPTFAEIRALELLGEPDAPDEFEDVNGHVSITGHLATHERASWAWIEALGLHSPRIASRTGIMDLEHHLRYLAEMRTGARLAVHLRWLGRSNRVVHGMTFALDLDDEVLVSTLEFTSAHVDLIERRAVPFDDDVAERLDTRIAEDERGWPAPVCGVMGVSRR